MTRPHRSHRPGREERQAREGGLDGHAARRAATRLRVMEAAAELMAEQGFTGTSVDEIAARAGVAKGTVFYNFGSKEQLFVELMRHGAGRMATRFQEATAGLDGAEALAAMVRAELESVLAWPAFAQLFVAEMYRGRSVLRQPLLEVRQAAVDTVRDVIVHSQQRGSADPTVEAEVAARLLVGVILVAALDWLAFTPERPLEEVHGQLLQILAGRFTSPAPAVPAQGPATG